MGNHTWEDLESFVRKESCVSPKKAITPESTIETDLGQQGDDADEFMQHFFEAFNLDRGDYDFHRYFLMEGEGILYHLMMKALRKSHSLKREALTVGMLYKALAIGKWDSQTLSRRSAS